MGYYWGYNCTWNGGQLNTSTRKAKAIGKEIRAKFSRGKIELLENVELEESEEIFITVRKASSPEAARDAFQRAAGAWRGLVDTDALLRDFKGSRKIDARDVQL